MGLDESGRVKVLYLFYHRRNVFLRECERGVKRGIYRVFIGYERGVLSRGILIGCEGIVRPPHPLRGGD